MKQLTCLILILSLFLTFAGCVGETEDPPKFYYLRTEETILYGEEQGFIAPVVREFSRDVALDTALQLYLDGPSEEGYYNPIPKGTYLLSTIPREDRMVIVLSREFSTLDGIHLTLAGACLAATCHDLTGMEKIQVRSADNIYDFDFNSFVFLDDSTGK
jgi:spore germination protein GerM